MLAVLGYFDLIWIFWIVAGVAWFASMYSGSEDRTQRVEAKLDRILMHLKLDDDDPPPP